MLHPATFVFVAKSIASSLCDLKLLAHHPIASTAVVSWIEQETGCEAWNPPGGWFLMVFVPGQRWNTMEYPITPYNTPIMPMISMMLWRIRFVRFLASPVLRWSLGGAAFKLHDFGFRGVSSVESAAMGGLGLAPQPWQISACDG